MWLLSNRNTGFLYLRRWEIWGSVSKSVGPDLGISKYEELITLLR